VQVFKNSNLVISIFIAATIAIFSMGSAHSASLEVSDCAKCHDQQPAEIDANGASHKTEIDCQACHASHRPKVENNIPSCNDCHEGADHYAVDNCLGCHNPHQPLNVKLAGELKAVCVSCHSSPAKEMEAAPSKHETFACNFCHADTHGVIPECVECHSPHSETMTQQNCGSCHQAHQPLTLTYSATTASVLCASCHETAYNKLTSSQAKHSQIACVTCHADKHKTVPQCSDCHGQPHAPGMHNKFPNCGDCHNIAHDLNNWPAEAK
jgi:predicted CXXCH cytochrome family protein